MDAEPWLLLFCALAVAAWLVALIFVARGLRARRATSRAPVSAPTAEVAGQAENTVAEVVATLPAQTRAVFFALGAFAPTPASFDVAVAEAITGAEPADIALLYEHGLLVQIVKDRYALPQAAAAVAEPHTPDWVQAQHASHYLRFVAESLHDVRRIFLNYPQIRHALARLEPGDPALVDWVLALRTYWAQEPQYQHERLHWTEPAVAVAEATGQRSAQALFLLDIGTTLAHSPGMQQAPAYIDQALQLYQELGDSRGQGEAFHARADACEELGAHEQALEDFQRALQCFRTAGDLSGEARCLSRIGGHYHRFEQPEQAQPYFEQALRGFLAVGDPAGTAYAYHELGLLARERGDCAHSLDYFTAARTVAAEAGLLLEEQIALFNYATTLIECGNADDGIAELQAGMLRADAEAWKFAWLYRSTLERLLAERDGLPPADKAQSSDDSAGGQT